VFFVLTFVLYSGLIKGRRKPGKPVSAAAGFFFAFGGGQNASFKIRAFCPEALSCPETLFPTREDSMLIRFEQIP